MIKLRKKLFISISDAIFGANDIEKRIIVDDVCKAFDEN
jgi:hypothetical protein